MIGDWSLLYRDLESEIDGQDETQRSDSREDDDVLVAAPFERHTFLHEFQKSKKGTGSKEEEEGDEDT